MATGPRPPHQEEETLKEVGTAGVRVKQEETEEEKEEQGQRDMPSVQIKPEPEEMECTVRRGGGGVLGGG